MAILESTISIKQSCQFARDKLESLYLLAISLSLLLQSSSSQSAQFRHSNRQVNSGSRNAPVLILKHQYQYKIIRLAPMKGNFKEHAHHLDGCTIHMASTSVNFASIGSDDIAFTIDLQSQQSTTHTVQNEDREEITAFCIDPRNASSYVIGTSKGCVKYMSTMHSLNLRKADVLYKCSKPIKNVTFDLMGTLIGVATQDEQAIVYSIKSKRIISLPKAHEGGTINMFFGGGYACSQGLQGNLHLYEIKHAISLKFWSDSESEEPLPEVQPNYEFVFIDSYKITTEAITRRFSFFNAVYAQFKGETNERVVLASGQTSLQVIQLDGKNSNYRLETCIREQYQILLIQVLSQYEKDTLPKCIVTSSVTTLSIWNYTKKEKIFTMQTTDSLKGIVKSMVRVLTPGGPSFFFVIGSKESSGKIYQFINHALFTAPPIETKPQPAQINVYPMQFVSRWEENKRFDQLIPDLTQFLLEKSYENFQGSRFLYYNSIGCIIERSQGGASAIQLQLHDKSRPKRLFLDARNRPFWLFALRQDVLVYATSALLVFQCDRHLKEGHEGWQFRWDNIQAVSLGNNYVAICSSEAVKILDYSGNELHTFCFDRRLVAFEAYEDMLAIVYHSGLPMWGCQALKVRIYRITRETVTIQRDTLMPIKANSLLKWFGFSQEGMLYCQDTLEVLRAYLYDRDQWMPVHSLEGSTDRLYIQHISGADIFGFKMQQKQGNREEPKVLPRSLPRRIPMDLPSLPLTFLTKEEDSHLKKLKLRNIQLQHQQFRHKRWYKFKYSRNKSHLWFAVSRNISSAQEIKTACTQLDLQLLDYLKKFLKRWETKYSKDYQKAAHSLMLIIDRQAHFDETKESARNLMEIGSKVERSRLLQTCIVGYPRETKTCITKVSQINILEKMLQVMNKC